MQVQQYYLPGTAVLLYMFIWRVNVIRNYYFSFTQYMTTCVCDKTSMITRTSPRMWFQQYTTDEPDSTDFTAFVMDCSLSAMHVTVDTPVSCLNHLNSSSWLSVVRRSCNNISSGVTGEPTNRINDCYLTTVIQRINCMLILHNRRQEKSNAIFHELLHRKQMLTINY